MKLDSAQRPKRSTIAAARWVGLVGQAAAIAMADVVFGFELPLGACAAILVFAATIHLASALVRPAARRVSDRELAVFAIMEVAQISGLLALMGGLANPFALFLLAPAATIAAVASAPAAAAVALASAAAAALIFVARLPLILPGGAAFAPPAAVEAGALGAFVACLAFIVIYARRAAAEALNMSTALAAAQFALQQEQRVSAIGALAAAAAHELGTPLATIKLTAAELRAELRQRARAASEDDAAEAAAALTELGDDADLIAQQADRCRGILQDLSSIRDPEDMQTKRAPIVAVLEEAAEPHRFGRAELVFRVDGAVADGAEPPIPQPSIPRRPELIHGLRNLIQNAADFAASTVWIDVFLRDDAVIIRIGDDGAGFADEIIDDLGEPFATTRGKTGRQTDAYLGMGLGLFIATTLLERTGAALTFENAPRSIVRAAPVGSSARAEPTGAEPTGAVVTVTWPKTVLTE